MKNSLTFDGFAACIFLLAINSASGQSDTTAPNQFWFTSDHYFTSTGATNAVITIQFSPGGRDYQGSVKYSTQNGTASATQDYTPTNGVLIFSGSSWSSITIPLTAVPGATTNKTILINLTTSSTDSNAIITRSNAVLQINCPPPPNLRIAPGPNGTMLVSWPDDGTDVFLETTDTPSSANWNALGSAPIDGNGVRCYTDVPVGGTAFYRLRRPQ